MSARIVFQQHYLTLKFRGHKFPTLPDVIGPLSRAFCSFCGQEHSMWAWLIVDAKNNRCKACGNDMEEREYAHDWCCYVWQRPEEEEE